MSTNWRMLPRLALLTIAIVIAMALVVGACSSGDDDSASLAVTQDSAASGGAVEASEGDEIAQETASADAESAEASADSATPEAPADQADEPVGQPIGTGGSDVGALQPSDIGRDLVFTAQISVAVEDVVLAGQQALRVIEGVGGLLFGQETSVAETPRTVLTFKVPPAVFQDAVTRLGEVGVLTDQVITADDVTERVVDLESRIITSESSVERLRGFLAVATRLETVASLERELLARETDLELLRGQLRSLQGQVDLATITVVLTQKQPSPELRVAQTYRRGADADTAATCRGEEDLDVDEGDEVTVCIEVVNEGDTAIDEIDVRLDALELELDDLTVVSGDPTELLRPGQAIVFSAIFEAGPSVFDAAVVTGRAVDANGVDLERGTVEARAEARLDVKQRVTLPGVGETFSKGWNALLLALSIAVLALAIAAPFVWVPLFVWLGYRWIRRRRAARALPTTAAPMPEPKQSSPV